MLMGMYRAGQFHDAEIFARALKALFEAYEIEFVRRAVDPVNGLPSRCKFPPTIAEVKEALEAEKARRFKIRATAQWMLAEHERRQKAKEEAARWSNLSEEELERRRKAVADLLGPKTV